MSSRAPLAPALCLLAGLVAAGMGCQNSSLDVSASIEEPAGAASAGEDAQWVLVSDRAADAVQVLEISRGLANLQFTPSPAQYFPLRIPAGPNPGSLVSLPGGEFVVVFNQGVGALSVIDTRGDVPVQKRVADEPYFYSLTPFGSGPSTLTVSANACDETCAGRMLVGYEDGTLLEVEVLDEGLLRAGRTWNLGQGIEAVATTASGVYAVATTATDVVRIRWATGATASATPGGRLGAVALSSDEGFIALARPVESDLLILGTDDLSLRQGGDGPGDIGCAPPCGDLDACGQLGLADAALCADGLGGLTSVTPYEGMILPGPPAHIFAIGSADGLGKIKTRQCSEDEDDAEGERRTYGEVFGAITEQGSLRLIGIKGGEAEFIRSEDWCESTALEPTDGDTILVDELADALGPCPDLPAQPRFECLCLAEGAGDSCAAGIGYARHTTDSVRLSFEWEGTIANRAAGGGALDEDGRFYDARSRDLKDFEILPGDVLEILSAPDPGCGQGDADVCVFERRIVGVQAGEGGRLVLDSPIDPECFPEDGIAYRIRVGDAFLVEVDGGRPYRMGPGDALGPGSWADAIEDSQGVFENIFLRFQEFGLPAGDACERQTGAVAPFLRQEPNALSPSIRIADRAEPLVTGLALSGSTVSARTSGTFPAAAVVVPEPLVGRAVVIPFAGNGAILAFSPFDLSLVPAQESVNGQGDFSSAHYTVIQ